MRFAFTTLACPTWSTEQIAHAAIEMGYDAVELRLLDGEVIDPHADAERLTHTVEVLRARRVDVCALDTSCSFNHHDPDVRREELETLLAWIQLAGRVEVPLLRVFGGAGKQGTPLKDGDERVSHALIAAAPEAERVGVAIVLETHDAFAPAERVARVLARVGSPRIAALWDIDVQGRTGAPPAVALTALGNHLAHVHVKDSKRADDGNRELTLLGEGETPVREALRLLMNAEYAGYVSVEWEKKWHPEIAEPEVALPQHIRWLRDVMADLQARPSGEQER